MVFTLIQSLAVENMNLEMVRSRGVWEELVENRIRTVCIVMDKTLPRHLRAYHRREPGRDHFASFRECAGCPGHVFAGRVDDLETVIRIRNLALVSSDKNMNETVVQRIAGDIR